MGDEQLRGAVILAQHARHLRFLNPGQRTIGYRGRCRHPQPLTREASFAEEVTLAQNRDDRLLALFGGHSEFHLAFPEIEQRVRRFSLREDVAVRTILNSGSPVRDSSEKRLARVLLLLAHFGKDSRSETVFPRISQDNLAQMVGTTRSRVSHFMNKFRKLGFIDYSDNGGLTVQSGLLSVVLHD